MDSFEEMINRNPLKIEPGHIEISGAGQLVYAGKEVRKLAAKYGTPLLVFDEKKIRANYRRMLAVFQKYYDKVSICFAYKSNSLLAVLRILQEEGAYADVVSEGELYKAECVGVPPEKIVMNGNNKSAEEISMAIEMGALLQIDSLSELHLVLRTAKKQGRHARVSMRVNPDVSAGVIDEFATALKKSKFGMDIENGEAFAAFQLAQGSDCCRVEGIHSHIGSQIETSRFYSLAVEKILNFCGKLKRELDLDVERFNMGGGFAIPFDYLDNPEDTENFAKTIGKMLREKVLQYGMKEPVLMIEPGGSLVGDTAITLLSVGHIKEKEGKKLAALNSGGDLLLRATQGWYTYRVVNAEKMNAEPCFCYDLAGPLCYEGDMIARNRTLPELETGDILAVIDTGAYVSSLFNNYNGRLSPAVLLVCETTGEVSVIRRRDTPEDLIRQELL